MEREYVEYSANMWTNSRHVRFLTNQIASFQKIFLKIWDFFEFFSSLDEAHRRRSDENQILDLIFQLCFGFVLRKSVPRTCTIHFPMISQRINKSCTSAAQAMAPRIAEYNKGVLSIPSLMQNFRWKHENTVNQMSIKCAAWLKIHEYLTKPIVDEYNCPPSLPIISPWYRKANSTS